MGLLSVRFWVDAGFGQGGLVKKAVMVLVGFACLDANVIDALVEEEESLRAVSMYWVNAG